MSNRYGSSRRWEPRYALPITRRGSGVPCRQLRPWQSGTGGRFPPRRAECQTRVTQLRLPGHQATPGRVRTGASRRVQRIHSLRSAATHHLNGQEMGVWCGGGV